MQVDDHARPESGSEHALGDLLRGGTLGSQSVGSTDQCTTRSTSGGAAAGAGGRAVSGYRAWRAPGRRARSHPASAAAEADQRGAPRGGCSCGSRPPSPSAPHAARGSGTRRREVADHEEGGGNVQLSDSARMGGVYSGEGPPSKVSATARSGTRPVRRNLDETSSCDMAPRRSLACPARGRRSTRDLMAHRPDRARPFARAARCGRSREWRRSGRRHAAVSASKLAFR